MEEKEFNCRPDFGVWLECIVHSGCNPEPSITRIHATYLYNKYCSQENWFMYHERLWKPATSSYIPLTEDEAIEENFSNAEWLGSPAWDKGDITKLIWLRHEWKERWYLMMTCPFGSGTKDKKCTGIGCMAWSVETEECGLLGGYKD